ncbi:MAG: transcriptional regulator FtsR [Sporichthyaceae bacterium]
MSVGQPRPASEPARPQAAGELLNIGEVYELLRADFPEVSISKIRFLESEGLVDPVRTPSGYRKFSAADIERLRYVLNAQKQYLPLKVIKDRLESRDAGDDSPEVPARLDREQMLAATGLTANALTALDDSGLLSRRRGGHYSADDVGIALLVGRLAAFGLEPRHLRAFKGAADRELGLIEQAAFPSGAAGTPEARAAARQTAAELIELCLALHAALLRTGVRRDLDL